MVNQQLINYIKASLGQGQTTEQVRQNLLQAGWSSMDVDEAFGNIRSNIIVSPPLSQSLPAVSLQPKYAGFWIRLVAGMIDGLVLSGMGIVIGIPFFILGIDTSSFSDILGIAVTWIYFVFMTYKYQATFGKMAVGINVVLDNAENLTIGRIILRETIGKFISMIILMIGYIMAGFTQKKQALHDKIAGTVVIYKDPTKKVKVWVIILALILPLIAIIGILASVALVSLNVARSKARDAKAKASMKSFMLEAVAHYDDKKSFVGYQPDIMKFEFPDCSGSPITNISSNGQVMAVLAQSCVDNEKYLCLSVSGEKIDTGYVPTDIKEIGGELISAKTTTCE